MKMESPVSGVTLNISKRPVRKVWRSLRADSVDLYYIHRLDKVTPIERTVAAMVELKNEGKMQIFGTLGVFCGHAASCVSTCCRSGLLLFFSHPLMIPFEDARFTIFSAVQVEYNPFSLEIEQNGLLDACRELGVAVVCYAPQVA
jgi:hypothetical protein